MAKPKLAEQVGKKMRELFKPVLNQSTDKEKPPCQQQKTKEELRKLGS